MSAPNVLTTLESVTIDSYRRNAFRVLQLGARTSSEEGLWRAESLSARTNAGVLLLEQEDLLPWLPPPDESLIWEAVHCLEQPLERLVEELFWFDVEADPDAEQLQKALTTMDAAEVERYLTKPHGDNVRVALNQANLRLLQAAKEWSQPVCLSSDAPDSPCTWESADGMAVVKEAHALDPSRARLDGSRRAAAERWSAAFKAWSTLLEDKGLVDHLGARIVEIEDDLIQPEDTETIIKAASTQLVERLVGELKRELCTGRFDRVGILLETGRVGGITSSQFQLALRPFRVLLKADVDELDQLLAEGDSLPDADVKLYLGRLKALRDAWQSRDPHGQLGMPDLVDEALLRVASRVSNKASVARLIRTNELLSQANEVASAGSARQRIATSLSQVAGLKRWACHYCGKRESDPERSVVLEGKKETGRTQSGGSTTIHYLLKWRLVPRCDHCSRVHQYLFRISWPLYPVFFVLLAAICFAIAVNMDLMKAAPFWCFIIGIAVCAGGTELACEAVRRSVGGLLKRADEQGYWSAASSEGYIELRKENFTVTVKARRNAYKELIAKQKR